MKIEAQKVDIKVVDIRKIISDGKLKAFADVMFADYFVVKGFSVLQQRSGLIVAPPRKAGKDGRWHDVLVFNDEAGKIEAENIILEAYEKEGV